jgi:dCTP deaminase
MRSGSCVYSVVTKSLFSELEPETRAPLKSNTGVLPHGEIEALIEARRLSASGGDILPDQIQPASLDIRLGARCFRVRCSFLPGRSKSVATRLDDLTMHELDLTQPTVLERGCVYVIEAMEQVRLPKDTSARANPKSTTGRLDVFTRLITDGADRFDRIEPGYQGKLYVEVSPRTFSVRLQQGVRLNQVRFTRGQPIPWDKHVRELHAQEPLVFDHDGAALDPDIDGGLWVKIDLAGRRPGDVVGYRARHHAPLIDLSKVAHYPWQEFWEPICSDSAGELVLAPDEFYILASSERVRVPLSYAAELAPIATDVGEFRIHYAGFFDPGFGYGTAGEVKGTPAVLEVRTHDVPFLLEHGQTVGKFRYERLSAPVTRPYGAGLGSSYHAQGLALAKQFR